jgi:hypothetical protein
VSGGISLLPKDDSLMPPTSMIITIWSDYSSSNDLKYCAADDIFRIGHLNVFRMQCLDGIVSECGLLDTCGSRFVVDRSEPFDVELYLRSFLNRKMCWFSHSNRSLLSYISVVSPKDLVFYAFLFVRQWMPDQSNWLRIAILAMEGELS